MTEPGWNRSLVRPTGNIADRSISIDNRPIIRVGAIGTRPHVTGCFDEDDCAERGLGVDMALFACEILRFQCVFERRRDSNYGWKADNGSWTGAVGDLMDGAVDTYIPVFTPTAERLEALRFSEIFLDDTVVLMTRMPDADDAISSNLVGVFPPGVWAMLAVVTSLIWMLRYVAGRLHQARKIARIRRFRASRRLDRWAHDDDDDRKRSTSIESIGGERGRCGCCIGRRRKIYRINRTGSMIDRSSSDPIDDDRPTYVDRLTCAQRWTYAVEWLLGLIVLSTISGVTVSDHLTGSKLLPFVDLQTFVDCLDDGRCQLATNAANTSFLYVMTRANNSVSRSVARALDKQPLLIIENESILNRMVDTRDVYLTMLMSARRADYVRRRYRGDHQFHVVETDLRNFGSFPFPISSNLTGLFDKVAPKLREYGFAQRLYRLYGKGQSVSAEKVVRRLSFRTQKIVRLRSMNGVFLLIGVGWLASILVCALERSVKTAGRVKVHEFHTRNNDDDDDLRRQ